MTIKNSSSGLDWKKKKRPHHGEFLGWLHWTLNNFSVMNIILNYYIPLLIIIRFHGNSNSIHIPSTIKEEEEEATGCSAGEYWLETDASALEKIEGAFVGANPVKKPMTKQREKWKRAFFHTWIFFFDLLSKDPISPNSLSLSQPLMSEKKKKGQERMPQVLASAPFPNTHGFAVFVGKEQLETSPPPADPLHRRCLVLSIRGGFIFRCVGKLLIPCIIVSWHA